MLYRNDEGLLRTYRSSWRADRQWNREDAVPTEFYAEFLGATIIEDSEQGIYNGMLKA